MNFTISKDVGVTVKVSGEYPWPWEDEPDHTIFLREDDVLTKCDNGKYMVHTGPSCFNIVLKDDEVIPLIKDAHLRSLFAEFMK